MNNIKLNEYYASIKKLKITLQNTNKLYKAFIISYTTKLNNSAIQIKNRTYTTFNLDLINMELQFYLFDKKFCIKKNKLIMNIIFSNFYYFYQFITKSYKHVFDFNPLDRVFQTLPKYDALNLFKVFTSENIINLSIIINNILSFLNNKINSTKIIQLDRKNYESIAVYLLENLLNITTVNNIYLEHFNKELELKIYATT